VASAKRGTAIVFGLLLTGRLVDRLNLPFERAPAPPASADSAAVRDVSGPAAGGRTMPHPPAAAAADSGNAVSGRASASVLAVPVNTAPPEELERLPGVGPVLAARIVSERTANGPFRSAADLVRVPGIGARTVVRLAPHLRFE